MADESSNDEDYDGSFTAARHFIEKRYPIHDCCEFEDVEALRRLVFTTFEEEEDDDEQDEDYNVGIANGDKRLVNEEVKEKDSEIGAAKTRVEDDDDSSSDDNDSTDAAKAAAIGHSPQPLKGPSGKLAEEKIPTSVEVQKNENETTDSQAPEETTPKDNNEIADTSSEGEQKPQETKEETKEETLDEKREELTTGTVESKKQIDELKPGDREVEPKVSPNDATEAGVKPSEEITKPKNEEVKDEPTPMEVEETKGPVVEQLSSSEDKDDGDGVNGSLTTEQKAAALERKVAKVTRTEVNRNVNLNERDDDENTPIHVAIHARKLEHVKVLLEAGASLRMKCDGSWPVHTAISIGAIREHRQFSYECVVVLHEHGADLTAKDDSLHTPLYLACMFNLPQVASYILSDEDGLSTLNGRADRAGNRPLHIAGKFDTLENPSIGRTTVASLTGQAHPARHHHPDGSVVTAMHSLPSVRSDPMNSTVTPHAAPPAAHPSTQSLLTQVLLGTNGIEVDAVNAMAQTPLHIACARGNWSVVRLLLDAGASTDMKDRRGFTPGQLAYKRGMPIPNDLVQALGDPPESGIIPPFRDLIVDPDGSTLLFCHELCLLHRTCPPITRGSEEPPPENVRRLHVLVDKDCGILRSGEFAELAWKGEARRAAMADILRVHEYSYVESISQMISSIPDNPAAIANLDPDTAVSRWSFEAALRAAGSVCEAVDRVVAGDNRNAFCAIRPPGHHAGPRGIVRCANDPEGGSHGFCLLNNVAIGAAYARSMYRNEGIRRIAIVDFDVHHGNGTEAVLRQLVPTIEKSMVRTPFASGELTACSYKPWLDETDIHNVFFSSTHGYGKRGHDQPGWFYPASGETHISEAITHPGMVEHPNISDFLLTQTWARMGEDSKANCCKIMNIGLDLPDPDTDVHSRNMKQRLELRDSYRKKVLPHLREFDPDLIFISAGFDGHRKDSMNFGYVGMVEDDYEWVTEQVVKVANTCCNGRVISVLEGGYKIHGGIVSPFARAVAGHVRALVDGGRSRELYDPRDGEWESEFEQHLYEKRERKREHEREQLRLVEEANKRSFFDQLAATGDTPDDPDAPSRKRRRNQVDYKELFRQMQQEGFG